MNKAVFIDKDGTLIHDVPYNVNPTHIRLQDGAGPCLKNLKDRGYKLVVISNQSGVAHGYFDEQSLTPVWETLQTLLSPYAVTLDGFYYCPHHPRGTVIPYATPCTCRKPMPGMLLKAAEELDITLSASWMVGDILDDIEAGNKAGCRTILINNGNETEWRAGPYREPTRHVKSFAEIANLIVT